MGDFSAKRTLQRINSRRCCVEPRHYPTDERGSQQQPERDKYHVNEYQETRRQSRRRHRSLQGHRRLHRQTSRRGRRGGRRQLRLQQRRRRQSRRRNHQRGGKAIAVQANVAKKADIDRLFAETKKAFGQLDVLVNNAGIFEFLPLEAITEEHFHRQFDLNVLGSAPHHAGSG